MFRCTECGVEKEDTEFYKARNKRGLTTKCKSVSNLKLRDIEKII